MAYYYDGVNCDTLAELNALRQNKDFGEGVHVVTAAKG